MSDREKAGSRYSWKRVAGWLMVAVVFGYFVYAQIARLGSRSFTWVSLDETRHAEVSFMNPVDGTDLAGLIFAPEGEGSFPAAVVIHGSGTSRRNSGWYLTMVSHLQEHGILVLLPDKRGSERSGGDWRTADFDDLAHDALAGVELVKGLDEVDPDRIGLIGLSQGGHIAPLAATLSDEVDFVVSVVGGVVPMKDVLVYEEVHNLRQMGIVPGLSDLLAPLTAWTIIHLRQRKFWSGIADSDPLALWHEVDVDALALFGENDTNVPTRRSVARLESIENPNIQIRVYEGSGHALEDPPGRGTSIFRGDALEHIREFIQSRPPRS
jgi:dienelactone hydrolase